MRRALPFVVVIIATGCARSGLELGDVHDGDVVRGGSASHGDDDTRGGAVTTGGAAGGTATGGIGGTGASPLGGSGPGATAGTAGSAGQTVVPDCGLDSPVFAPVKEQRWLGISTDELNGVWSRYLVEMTPDGPRNLMQVAGFGEPSSLGGWSFDGRYFAVTTGNTPSTASVHILDLSQGETPLPVQTPQRNGAVRWSPTDTRYLLVTDPASGGGHVVLTVVNPAASAESIIEPHPDFDAAEWSPDGSYLSFTGDTGLFLLDARSMSLIVRPIHEGPVENPLWSPNGSYLAFVADTHLYVYDTRGARVKIVGPRPSNDAQWRVAWYRDDWLAFTDEDANTFFVDMSQEPLAPIELVGQHDLGTVSPGGKCVAYQGGCSGDNNGGICIRPLPPERAEPSVSIGRDAYAELAFYWAGTGEHLLLEFTGMSELVHVETHGGSLLRHRVDGPEPYVIPSTTLWNASGRDDSAYYGTRAVRPTESVEPQLWHRESQESVHIDIGAGFDEARAWSPDGRYLAIRSVRRDARGTYMGQDLYVHEVIDGDIRRTFRLEQESPTIGTGRWDMKWQP